MNTATNSIDIKKIVQDPKVIKQVTDNTLLTYNMTQYVHVDIDKKRRMLITPYNNESGNIFYDYDLNNCYKVDQITKEAHVINSVNLPTITRQVSDFRTEISKAIQTYISRYYVDNKCLSGVYVDNNNLIICLSAINTNLNVYWTGNIRATYTLPMNSGTQKLHGKIETIIHYFEEGNVQLHCNYTIDDSNGPSYNTTSVDSLIKAITNVESNWMNSLESMYITMHEDTFKRMRRRLPISGQYMDWNPNAHTIQTEIKK